MAINCAPSPVRTHFSSVVTLDTYPTYQTIVDTFCHSVLVLQVSLSDIRITKTPHNPQKLLKLQVEKNDLQLYRRWESRSHYRHADQCLYHTMRVPKPTCLHVDICSKDTTGSPRHRIQLRHRR